MWYSSRRSRFHLGTLHFCTVVPICVNNRDRTLVIANVRRRCTQFSSSRFTIPLYTAITSSGDSRKINFERRVSHETSPFLKIDSGKIARNHRKHYEYVNQIEQCINSESSNRLHTIFRELSPLSVFSFFFLFFFLFLLWLLLP